MHLTPITVRLMRHFVWLLAALPALGCVGFREGLPRTYPLGLPVVGRAEPDGWVHVQEPGWFSAAMPAAPRTGEDGMKSSAGAFRIKIVSTQLPAGERYQIYYAEPSTLPSDEAMFREAHSSFAKSEGVTFTAERRFEIQGRKAFQIDLLLPPDSEFNGGKTPAVSHIRMVRDGSRYFQLEYTASKEHADDQHVARFFDSFEIAQH